VSCTWDGKAVALAHDGGDAALGQLAGAVAERAFGQDRHAVGGGQVQGRAQAGKAAANDEDVEMVGRRGHGVRTRMKFQSGE